MSSTMFSTESEKPVEPKVNVETKPVEAKVDGEEKSDDRRYNGEDLAGIVKERLNRERKKLAKEYEARIAELEAKVGTNQKVSPNIEEDLRGKLSKYENEKKSLADKLSKYRDDSLRAQIERALNAHECLDAEVVIDHFLSRNLVHLDDDDNIVVENGSGRLDELCKDYLDKKPHLKKGTSQGGLGTKGPSRPAAVNGPTDMTTEELGAALGVQRKKNNFFGR